LKVHSEGKTLSEEIDLREVAKRCVGMSGADLQNLLNESAIFSARKEKLKIEVEDVYGALDRI
jgi:cell division protease FtsH